MEGNSALYHEFFIHGVDRAAVVDVRVTEKSNNNKCMIVHDVIFMVNMRKTTNICLIYLNCLMPTDNSVPLRIYNVHKKILYRNMPNLTTNSWLCDKHKLPSG